MKSKLTFSLVKVYLGVAGFAIVCIYQLAHGQAAEAAATFSAALALLGIGNQTAATRATVDPNVARSPAD